MLAQGKSVKSIIDDWNNELNAHSRAFVADAQSLAEWDDHIRRKRRELLEMEAHLNRVCLQCSMMMHWLGYSCTAHVQMVPLLRMTDTAVVFACLLCADPVHCCQLCKLHSKSTFSSAQSQR